MGSALGEALGGAVARKDGFTAPFDHGYAWNDVAAGQTEEIVAAVPGRRIRVLKAAFLCGDTDTTAIFKSASTQISPTFQNGANSGAVLPEAQLGWFETERGEALNVTLGAGSQTGVLVSYFLI
jgi:hypothetical protein